MLVLGAGIAMRRGALAWLGITLLMVEGVYFLASLRLGYFQEWRYDADAKHLYWVLTDWDRRCGSTIP